MKVSLVMATYNGHDYLIEQLDSIKNQTRRIDEVIIIDDVSSDDTVILIKDYINKYQLDWKLIENEVNLGYRDNFKKGLSLASGDVIFLSDQDDRFHLDKVERMLSYLNDSNVLTLASSFNFMNQNGDIFNIELKKGRSNNNLLYQEVNNKLTKIDLRLLLETNFSQGCTMAIKRSVIEEFLKYSNSLLPHDWELNIFSAINEGCYYLDIPLIDYRIHDNNTIGMENIVDNNVIDEKKARINERITQTKEQLKNVNFTLGLKLDSNQKNLCNRYQEYLMKRIDCMENKKLFSIVFFYIKGKYKGFGHLKTFLGDVINILK